MREPIKADHLYKPQSKVHEIDLDIIRSHAAHMCLDTRKHSKWVVCWPCQEEALKAYGYQYSKED